MMLHYSEFRNHIPEDLKINNKYNDTDIIFTLDTESSVFINHKTGWGPVDYSKLNEDSEYYNKVEKFNYCYIWMVGIDDGNTVNVYYGRFLYELDIFFSMINRIWDCKKCIYVHNLPYDFRQLLNIFAFDNIFARKPQHPIKAELSKYNFEFRCSYALTNMSLEKCAREFSLPVSKKSGDLDYTICRHSLTPLTEKEMGYCEYDIIVLSHLIRHFLNEYNRLKNIPMTSTGITRRKLKTLLLNENKKNKLLSNMRDNTYLTPEKYNYCKQSFCGGYCHANAILTNVICEQISSWDIGSSYPCVMTTYKLPMGKFELSEDKIEDILKNVESEEYSYLMYVKLYGLSNKGCWSYLSSSKSFNDLDEDTIVDNGRIMYCKEYETVMTHYDLDTVIKNYNYEKIEILKLFKAKNDYLPKPIIEFILENYVNKTALKGVEGEETAYQNAKRIINSIYGLSCTNLLSSAFCFDEETQSWTDIDLVEYSKKFNDKLNADEITEDDWFSFLNECNEEHFNEQQNKRLLPFQIGSYITAIARHKLWESIQYIDSDAIYVDTDSIKFRHLEDYKEYFDELNNKVLDRNRKAANELGIDYNMYSPKTIKGVEKPIGVWEYEGSYDKFITLGAKKYCYEKDGETKLTVSGLGYKGNSFKIEDFKVGYEFDSSISGRTISYLLTNQNSIIAKDYLGNEMKMCQKYGQAIINTTYTLGISSEFDDLITQLQETENELDMILILKTSK